MQHVGESGEAVKVVLDDDVGTVSRWAMIA